MEMGHRAVERGSPCKGTGECSERRAV